MSLNDETSNLDQTDEQVLTDTDCDEALEDAAGTGATVIPSVPPCQTYTWWCKVR